MVELQKARRSTRSVPTIRVPLPYACQQEMVVLNGSARQRAHHDGVLWTILGEWRLLPPVMDRTFMWRSMMWVRTTR